MIHIRADSAFGGPEEYETLESLPNVTYTIGMKLNPKIKRLSDHRFMANARHQRNCLGEAHPRTWRMLVTKVAARIIVSARRVRILLSASWPECALPAPRCGGCGELRASLKP